MALSVGSLGLSLKRVEPTWTGRGRSWRAVPVENVYDGLARVPPPVEAKVGPGLYRPWIGPAVAARSNREATNSELRTGSD